MVRAGYVEYGREINSNLGVPQGGIASPILSNLILHELDTFVESIMQENNNKLAGRRHTIRNPVYTKIEDRIHTISRLENKWKISGRALDTTRNAERIELIKQRAKIPSTLPNANMAKLYYVRYADDWLIGVAGSSIFARDLKAKISEFLSKELKLELSEEKTLITNAAKGKAYFLGTEIQRISSVKGEIKRFLNVRGHSKRIPTTALILNTPISRLIAKLQEKGLVEWNSSTLTEDNLSPKPLLKWMNLPIRDIILRYRMILNGLFNYYSFVNNKPRLILIYWILRKSLAKTLAAKLKLGTARKVHLKLGINLTYKVPETGKEIDFSRPSLLPTPNKFNGNTNLTDSLRVVDWKLRTVNAFDRVCVNCGAEGNLQMHHVKHIKTVNVKLNSFDNQLAGINRKQVPLCFNCHTLVHSGKYDGVSLRHK